MRGTSLLTALAVVAAATGLSLLGMRARADDPPPDAGAPEVVPGGPSASAAASAAPSADAGAPEVPARSDRVTAYTISAELFPSTHSVRATGTIAWRNTARVATDKLYVHLYLNAFKDARTVFWRVPISDFRGDPLDAVGRIDVERFFARELGKELWPEKPASPGDPDDATNIEIALPRPIEPGESLTIETAWTSHLPTVTIRTGYYGSFHMVAQWFPKLARLEPDGTWSHFPFHRLSEFYADYGTYDVTIVAPKAFVIGAVGTLAAQTPEDDARDKRRYVAEDVHDFAFAAWDGFRSIEDTTDDGVKMTCLFPEGYESAARDELATAKFGLGYYGAAFGRYPYATLTIVHPPWGATEAGGMEYPTLITTGGSWMKSPTSGRALEIVTLHELAHQWFYGLVGTNEHRWPFLDEGLTSYAETDACEAMWPDASMAEELGLRLGLPAGYRAWSLQSVHNARASDPAPAFMTGRDYGGLVYARVATVMRTLGNVYGEDTVRRAVGLYARRFRFRHPSPDDFFATMRESLGPEGADALRVALTEPSSVDYVADAVMSERRSDGKPGFVGHALVRRRGAIRLPVDVLLIAADGATKTVRWDAATESARLPYEGSAALVGAVIDPGHRVLLDQDLANNAIRKGGSRFAWRLLEAGAFAGGALARGILP